MNTKVLIVILGIDKSYKSNQYLMVWLDHYGMVIEYAMKLGMYLKGYQNDLL